MSASEDRAAQRVSSAERQAAIEALGDHARAGRISGTEYEDRSQGAKNAVTWADLLQLFGDLPEPHPVPGAPAAAPAPAVPPPVASPPVTSGPATTSSAGDVHEHRGLIPAPYAAWVVSLSPFIAMALFFTTDEWWWWWLIPVAGIIAYGPRERNR